MLARREARLLSATIALFALVALWIQVAEFSTSSVAMLAGLLALSVLADVISRNPEVSGGSLLLLTIALLTLDFAAAATILLLHWAIVNSVTGGEKPLLLAQRLASLALMTLLLASPGLGELVSDALLSLRVIIVCVLLSVTDPIVYAVVRTLVFQVPAALVVENGLRRVPTTGAFASVAGLHVLLADVLGVSALVIVACLALVVGYSLRQFSQIQQAYLETVEAVIRLAKAERPEYGAYVEKTRERSLRVGSRLALSDQEMQSLHLAALLCSTRIIENEVDAIDLVRDAFDLPEALQVHPDSQLSQQILRIAGIVRGSTLDAIRSQRDVLLAYVVFRITESQPDSLAAPVRWERCLRPSTLRWVDRILAASL